MTDTVSLRYFVKVLRELQAEGKLKALHLLLEDAWFDNRYVYWKRGSVWQ